MATDTIRERIIAAIVTRLAIVMTAKGFNTGAGANVTRAAMNIDPAKTPCLNVLPQVETVAREYGAALRSMTVKVEAMAAFGTSNPSAVAESLLGDMIEAMTGSRWTLAFTSGGTVVPVVGNTIEGATSKATAFIEAITVTSGTWAGGDAAGSLTLRRYAGAFISEKLKIGVASDVATIAGPPTGVKAVTLSTGGLAEGVNYIEGGPKEYPEGDDQYVGCSATFQVNYQTRAGDPYSQP